MTNKSSLFTREPAWQQNRVGTRHRLPEAVQSWVYEPGSLTRRLRDCYGPSVGVTILSQQWREPFLSERRVLKLAEHRYSLIREVMLHAGGEPLILARTVIPDETIKAAKRNLAHLGARPLGEIIFSYPKLQRMEMDVVLAGRSVWTPSAIALAPIDNAIWGRRTVYEIVGHQMLVNEFFLPELLAAS